jgi:hypothetical protein
MPKWCLNTARVASALCLASACGLASAVTIDFGNLLGANEAPYAGSLEDGFGVAPTDGNWFEGHFFGNPEPSIFAGPIGQVNESNTVNVTRVGLGDFTFTSVDLACNNATSCPFEVVGQLDGNFVLFFDGLVTGGPPFGFFTQFNPFPGQVVDALDITIRTSAEAPATSMNLDNIVVVEVSVPEPATLALLGLALAGLGYSRRSRTPR